MTGGIEAGYVTRLLIRELKILEKNIDLFDPKIL